MNLHHLLLSRPLSGFTFPCIVDSMSPLLRTFAYAQVWAGKKYDEACDVWSLGTVVYELAALEPPFQGQSLMQLRRAVAAGMYAPLPSSYSPQLGRILAQMLTVDPHRRIKALDILEHEEVTRRRKEAAGGGFQISLR